MEDVPGQLEMFPEEPFTAEETRVLRESLTYALAMSSRGCPYAPQWTPEQTVFLAGPLRAKLAGQ